MSAATMSGPDVRSSSSTGSKQQLKSSTSTKTMENTRNQAGSPVDGQSKKQPAPAPRAWQGGINPITQKAAAATPNGTADKTAPKSQPQAPPQQKSAPSANADKHAHDRALYLIASFTGLDATLTLKNGEQFTGIFSGASFDTPNQKYILKMVRRTRLPSHLQVNGNIELELEYLGEGEDHVMAFDKEDTIDLFVPDVTPATAQPVQNGSISSSFRTDAEISSRDAMMGRARELERWIPDAHSTIDMSLGDSGSTGWDQFAANERMYGVESTYDESIYTTEINRNDPRYRRLESEAARIAAEIEGSAPTNAHVAEERRTDAVGEGVDEEEKYSGVQREAAALPKRAAGAYVPPSQRSITNAPTVPGAPFDPAIISLAKPTLAAGPENSAEPVKTPELTQGQKTPQTEPPVKDNRLASQNAASLSKRPMESTTEDHVRNVADSFKQFANNEKLRLRQAQETKRVTARAEKTVKLNDLKKFAANFKLKSRVPDDLVPILAKDREKQIEIQHKAEEAAKDEEARRVEREKAKAAGLPSPVLASTAVPAATTVPFAQQSSSKARPTPRGVPFTTGPSMASPGRPAGMPPNRGFGRAGFPAPAPLPADLRMPPAPVMNNQGGMDTGPLSPTKSLNAGAKAFEFRPGASNFTPTGVSPSPQRSPGKLSATAPESADFFRGRKPVDNGQKRSSEDAFNPLTKEYNDEQKKANAANGGIPNPYRTPPTWPHAENKTTVSYRDSIPKPIEPGHAPSHMHNPNPNSGQMPHPHQMPHHMSGPPPPQPSNRPPYIPNHHQHPPNYGPGMPHFGPNGSVQNSPRFQQPQMAFNGQMPNMQMPQFAGQPQYQMSPSLQYRSMNMAPPGNMMMMPNHPQGGMPGMPQGYPPPQMQPRGPPNYNGGQMLPNGAPPNFMPSYSPMPPHATPHGMQQPPQQHPYAASPRPPAHMMQQTVSQPGFNPNVPHMGPMGGMPYGPSPGAPGGPYPHHMQQRHMSAGGYPHMTPRQGQVVPVGMQHSSPGAGGDEGK